MREEEVQGESLGNLQGSIKEEEKIIMAKRKSLKKGTICKLLKSKRVVRCYNKKGELISAWVVKRKK